MDQRPDRCCAAPGCCRVLVQQSGEQLSKFKRRETRGADCSGELRAYRRLEQDALGSGFAGVQWPRVTGEFTGSFAGQDIKFKQVGPTRFDKPITHSPCGNAAARCAE